MVRSELSKTLALQLHLSRTTLQTDCINFTTKSKIMSYTSHKRHQALCISAALLLGPSLPLSVTSAPLRSSGWYGDNPNSCYFWRLRDSTEREKNMLGKNQKNHLLYYFAVVPLQPFHKHSLISHFGQGINGFGNQSYPSTETILG